jgi:hypothetical protein
MNEPTSRSHKKLITRRGALAAPLGILAMGPGGAQADTPGSESNPGATNILYKVVAGNAPYRGKEVPYIYVRNDSPTSPDRVGGSSLVYCPPCDFVRDEQGRPIIEISDPTRGGDGLYVPSRDSGSTVYYQNARDLADVVAKGVVAPDIPVNVAFDLRLHDEPALRKTIWRACLAQLQPVERRGGLSTADTRGAELARVMRAVYMLPAHSLILRCGSPGLETIGAELTNSPMLGDRLPVQFVTTARYLNQVFSRAGVLMYLEFTFSTYGEGISFIDAEQSANAIINLLMESQGGGGTIARANGNSTHVEVLTSRQALDRTSQALQFRGRVLIRAATTEDINILLGLLQRSEPDLAGNTVDQAQAYLDANFDRVKALTMPGYLSVVKDGKNVEQLTDEEHEKLFAEFQSSFQRAQSGGGFALGPASHGSGSGSEDASSKAWKEQRRDQIRRFVSDLHTYTLQGHLPVQPKVDYRIVAVHRIQSDFQQQYILQRAHRGIRTNTLGCGFTTARPTLRLEADQVPDVTEEIDELLNRTERVFGPLSNR